MRVVNLPLLLKLLLLKPLWIPKAVYIILSGQNEGEIEILHAIGSKVGITGGHEVYTSKRDLACTLFQLSISTFV